MKKTLIIVLTIFVITGIFFGLSFAESDESANKLPEKPVDQSSANYEKAKKLLPGEEVVTPTGQKLKVWSTEGPVPVSKAPEPFEDREKSVLDNPNIVIDAESVRKKNRERDSN